MSIKKPKVYSILIEEQELDEDNPRTSIVCRDKEGKFHKVFPLAGEKVECPEGYIRVRAIKKLIKGRFAEIMIIVDDDE